MQLLRRLIQIGAAARLLPLLGHHDRYVLEANLFSHCNPKPRATGARLSAARRAEPPMRFWVSRSAALSGHGSADPLNP